ncbi:MAG TPA: DUF1549 and DUF1553 domain-containing protein [Gemmataceae bacterium]|nr:DUF1549 and DUF1553 domain-containing protein [Gemmataceae bacterium]
MIYFRLLLMLGGIFLVGSGSIRAAAPDKDAAALAASIDRRLAAAWEANQIQPAPPADDAEFLRRAYLDLAGRIPAVAEVRAFFDDKRPDKRQRLVEQLLEGPRYVTHFTNVWRSLLLPETTNNLQAGFLAPGFETWLRAKLQQNTPYDAMVRELLTVPMDRGRNPFAQPNGVPTPIAFYLAKDVKPENLAAAVSRLFLGVKIECAQCHNHPFAEWKREQFWSFAAFFAGLQRQGNGDFVTAGREMADRRELTIPGTERVVQAAFLDGDAPKWNYNTGARATLAEWMTRKDNPYFARAAVNRLWGYFFGSGIIDPIDEIAGGEHEASHPELFDDLARQFAEHNFDLKFLIRALTSSRAYQLSSLAANKGQDDPRQFARMPLRGLSAEQLFDSIAQATGYRETANPNPRFFGNPGVRGRFLTKFANTSDKPTEVQTSILQALSMMNGQVTDLRHSETLEALLDSPFMNTAERVETLYLAALARKPTPRELSRMVKYVEDGGSAELPTWMTKAHALADVFWILLNSGEFFLNH